MYKDYLDRIREKYNRLKASKDLTPRMEALTNAGLRDECVDEFKRRYLPKDENTLRTFFRHTGDIKELVWTIENKFDIQKFKQPIKFLKGGLDDTSLTNIELLAWLVDFEKRPYDDREDYGAAKYQQPKPVNKPALPPLVPDPPLPPPITPPIEVPIPPNPEPSKRKLSLSWKWVLIPATGLAAYLAWPTQKSKSECMYWSGDHFETILCNEKNVSAPVVKFDQERFKKFRKVTQPDTITHYSAGKLWYYKVGKDSLEIYTDGGRHPIDTGEYVKKLTSYMINQHLLDSL